MKRRNFIKHSSAAMALPLVLPNWAETISDYQVGSNKVEQDLGKIQSMISNRVPSIWLFTGDSITHGAKHTHGYRSYPEVFQERIRYEIGTSKNVVINTGISGNTAQNILNDYQWRIGQFNPGLVSLMIGTNDCSKKDMNVDKFYDHVSQLIGKMRKGGIIPILHTPNVIIQSQHPERASFPEYVPVLRKVAADQEVILVDNFAHWTDEINKTSQSLVFKNWLNDGLHPNGFGHQVIAQSMFKALNIFDKNAPTCGAPFYEGKH